jgi:hypothetical protein
MTGRNFVDSGLEDGFAEEEETSAPEPQGSLWKKGKDGKYRPVLIRTRELPYLAIAVVALLGVIGGGLYLFSGDGNNSERTEALEKRLSQVESRLSRLEAGGSGNEQGMQRQKAAIDKMGARFNRLESSLGKRIDQLASDVKRLKTAPATQKGGPPGCVHEKAARQEIRGSVSHRSEKRDPVPYRRELRPDRRAAASPERSFQRYRDQAGAKAQGQPVATLQKRTLAEALFGTDFRAFPVSDAPENGRSMPARKACTFPASPFAAYSS